MLDKKYVDACEMLDWSVWEDFDGTVELEKHSPAGEDFSFCVDAENFLDEVKEYAAYFDVDEHVELYVNLRGENGVPSSVRELVEDAEAIDAMVTELARVLQRVQDGTTEDVGTHEDAAWMLGEDLILSDCLLDGLTFQDVVLAVHCSSREITPEAVRTELNTMLETRMQDMNFLLEKNMDAIMAEAKKGR